MTRATYDSLIKFADEHGFTCMIVDKGKPWQHCYFSMRDHDFISGKVAHPSRPPNSFILAGKISTRTLKGWQQEFLKCFYRNTKKICVNCAEERVTYG